MPANLNTSTSVVDYLRSVGQDSSYGNRANLYKSANLNLGAYTGAANQNTALLSYLRGSGSQSAAPATATPTVQASPQAGSLATPTTTVTPRTDYVAKAIQEQQTAAAANNAKVDEARTKYSDYLASLEPYTDRLTRLRTEQGVDTQQSLVNALTKNVMTQQDLLDAIPDSVTQRTGDFFVTEADRTAITAREQQPVLQELNKLLRNKQYEEIGLSGKQALVSELLQLSIKDDELRGKPLQLGVDYSEKDRDAANALLSSLTSNKISAYSADLTAEDNRIQQQNSFAQQLLMQQNDQAAARELENLRTANDLKIKASGTAKTAKDQVTEDAWNSILGSAKTEYDVWKAIDDNQATLRSKGVDVDKLWSKHAALAGDVGVGNAIRKTSTDESNAELVRILSNM